jgi:hypothetical protein
MKDWNWKFLKKVPPAFKWVVDEFRRAAKQRETTHLGTIAGSAQVSFTDALFTYDPATGEHFADFLKRKRSSRLNSSIFYPPGWGPRKRPKQSLKWGLAVHFYYVSHFMDRMLFSNDLRYSVEMLPPDDIRTLFTTSTGFQPENIFPIP